MSWPTQQTSTLSCPSLPGSGITTKCIFEPTTSSEPLPSTWRLRMSRLWKICVELRVALWLPSLEIEPCWLGHWLNGTPLTKRAWYHDLITHARMHNSNIGFAEMENNHLVKWFKLSYFLGPSLQCIEMAGVVAWTQFVHTMFTHLFGMLLIHVHAWWGFPIYDMTHL